MNKKPLADFYWFALSHGPDASGRIVRLNVVTCRKCGASASHTHGISVETLRRMFTRKGWYIGRARNQHLCPDCAAPRKQPAVAAVQSPPAPAVVSLDAAWAAASESERAAFLLQLRHKGQPVFDVREPVVAEAELELTDTNSEPADWWAELMDRK